MLRSIGYGDFVGVFLVLDVMIASTLVDLFWIGFAGSL